HGMDQVLGRSDTPLMPQAQGFVARSVLEAPPLRQRYRERIGQLLTNVFNIESLTNRTAQVAQKIQLALADAGPRTDADFPQRAQSFNRRLVRRVRALESQITPAKPAQEFDGAGFARVKGWRPQTDLGEATLTQEKDANGKTFLRISAQEACAASWRSRVV